VEIYYLGILNDVVGRVFCPVELEVITIRPLRCRVINELNPQRSIVAARAKINMLAGLSTDKDVYIFSKPLTREEIL